MHPSSRRPFAAYALLIGVVGFCLLVGITVWWSTPGRAQASKNVTPERPPSHVLPLSSVVLFNTGVGYFQREGEIDGDTRVDLNFPATDINDLIKSLVLHDTNKMGTISYDGQESLDRALRSFALDLTYNPTYGQILNQARGEKIEVSTTTAGAGNTITGEIVGMESAAEDGGKEVHHLNLLTSDGMRRVQLNQIQRVRFLNPVLEDEFRRALGVLAGTHNNQRRSVRVQIKGEGKRNVKLGYVVESPIWKANYRLMLGKGKDSTLQSWAVLENTSDEDWKDIRVALIAARPISFQMDLAQPLFLPRPTVEPRAYASLRPHIFQGNAPVGGGGAQLGGLQLGGFQLGVQLGVGGGQPGGKGIAPLNMPGGGLAGLDAGTLTGNNPTFFNRYQVGPGGPLAPPTVSPTATTKLTYEDLQERREEMLAQKKEEHEKARRIGGALAELGEGLDAVVANADNLGDTFRYTIEQKVNLPRQMSALVPIFNAAIQNGSISIFNKQIHPRFPLKALRLKNTTGQNIVQGPVSVFEDSVYAGDSQIPDMQPDQDRLISYAMDLGVEVRDQRDTSFDPVTRVRLNKGILSVAVVQRAATFYTLKNRATQDRTVLVEHNITPNWTFTGPDKLVEKTAEHYRVEWKVPAGKTETKEVHEESEKVDSKKLVDVPDATLKSLLSTTEANKAVHDLLRIVLEKRGKVAIVQAELGELNEQRQANEKEQDRLRANIDKVPKGSAVEKRYLDSLNHTEAEFVKLRELIREKTEAEKKLRLEVEEFQKKVTVE